MSVNLTVAIPLEIFKDIQAETIKDWTSDNQVVLNAVADALKTMPNQLQPQAKTVRRPMQSRKPKQKQLAKPRPNQSAESGPNQSAEPRPEQLAYSNEEFQIKTEGRYNTFMMRVSPQTEVCNVSREIHHKTGTPTHHFKLFHNGRLPQRF